MQNQARIAVGRKEQGGGASQGMGEVGGETASSYIDVPLIHPTHPLVVDDLSPGSVGRHNSRKGRERRLGSAETRKEAAEISPGEDLKRRRG